MSIIFLKQEKKNGKKDGIRETARKLLKMGLTIEQIIEATNLSKKEIEELKKE